ncbi:1779_t:CDS:10 [Diversispora eburnea]|uniref:tRNA-dihydrouridine(47) synthase [NAD(P)(+)] n=3 Tax=Diversisporales TaxID=214509 RepID=A0A9N8V0A2_9GLOM|nr:1779_t:CDS:10 [Diversispora eburnea]
MDLNRGIAPVKKEHIIDKRREKEEEKLVSGDETNEKNETKEEPPRKKSRITRVRGKKEKANNKFIENTRLCLKTSMGLVCETESCKFDHDLDAYLKTKEKDLGDKCVNFENSGKCRFGYKCRFLNAHLSSDGKLIVNEDRVFLEEKNVINMETQKNLRKNVYQFPKSDAYMVEIEREVSRQLEMERKNKLEKLQSNQSEKGNQNVSEVIDAEVQLNISSQIIQDKSKETKFDNQNVSEVIDTEVKPSISSQIIQNESKETKFDVELDKKENNESTITDSITDSTTSNNLLDADIEASVYTPDVPLRSEWALMKRHVSEDIFGVQICGCKVQHLVKCAELLNNEVEVDFVDVNLGCPIDIVFNKGAGTALLKHDGKLGKIFRGMDRVMDFPVTVKLRTGIQDEVPLAHKLVPKFENWLHGRSRQQRYTKLANWDYISNVSNKVKEMPFFGNGDVLGYTDYYKHLENHNVDGVMIARGALIKSKRHYDISSKERFEILKKFCNYGLEHWGSDSIGVNKTRRFLCEWFGFLHRYIPVGLLEVLPQRINDRPPFFRGRDDLETLMASPNSNDWIKLR